MCHQIRKGSSPPTRPNSRVKKSDSEAGRTGSSTACGRCRFVDYLTTKCGISVGQAMRWLELPRGAERKEAAARYRRPHEHSRESVPPRTVEDWPRTAKSPRFADDRG